MEQPKVTIRKFGLLIGVLVPMAIVTPAHALNFLFSFSNVTGNVPGVVSGKIYGLTDNATSFPTDVVVTAYPAGINGLAPAPLDINAYAASLGSFINSYSGGFSVANGQITGGDYQIYGGYFDLNIFSQYNTLFSPDASNYTGNLDGLGGVTFTATPEPATWAMMLVGLGGLGFALRRSRRIGSVIAKAG